MQKKITVDIVNLYKELLLEIFLDHVDDEKVDEVMDLIRETNKNVEDKLNAYNS